MNPRIRELVDQSYIYDKQNDSSFFDKQKFAELIIRDAMQLCSELAESYSKMAKGKLVTPAGQQLYEGMWGGAKNCSATLAEHFEIET